MEPDDRVRIDKWLWAARFFKTRSLATEAVDGGKVEINGERAKPSKLIKPGDELRLRLGPYEHILIVRALGEPKRDGQDVFAAAGLMDQIAHELRNKSSVLQPTADLIVRKAQALMRFACS